MSRKIFLTLILLSMLAFAARVGVVLFEKPWRTVAGLKAMEHRSIALALVNGEGFTFGDWKYYGPTSVQSPPFPLLLAGMFEVFGTDVPPNAAARSAHSTLIKDNLAYIAILFLNAIAGAALVWVTYSMTVTLGGSKLAGVIAAGLVAIWPSQLYAAATVQAISLITLCVGSMTILYYKSIRTGMAGPWIGYSVVSVIATLTEPVLLPALLFSGALILFCRSIPFKARLRNAAVLGFAIIAIIGPWAVRNRIVHNKIIPIKGTFWVNVWKGNNDYATGTDRLKMTPAMEKHLEKESTSLSDDDLDSAHQYDMLDISKRVKLDNEPEAVREGLFREFALSWIQSHPQRYAQLCGIRLLKTITTDWDHPKSRSVINLASRGAILLMTLGGIFIAIKQRWSFFFPILLMLTALGTYTLTITAARFAIPFEPFQLALGGAFIAALVPAGRRAPEQSAVEQAAPTGASFSPAH
jgi:hypothetical protein